jgi:hypothetical protein
VGRRTRRKKIDEPSGAICISRLCTWDARRGMGKATVRDELLLLASVSRLGQGHRGAVRTRAKAPCRPRAPAEPERPGVLPCTTTKPTQLQLQLQTADPGHWASASHHQAGDSGQWSCPAVRAAPRVGTRDPPDRSSSLAVAPESRPPPRERLTRMRRRRVGSRPALHACRGREARENTRLGVSSLDQLVLVSRLVAS